MDLDRERSVRERLRPRRERDDRDRPLRLLSPSSCIKSYSPLRERDRLRLRRKELDLLWLLELLSDRLFRSLSETRVRLDKARYMSTESPNATMIQHIFSRILNTSPSVLYALEEEDEVDDDEPLLLPLDPE